MCREMADTLSASISGRGTRSRKSAWCLRPTACACVSFSERSCSSVVMPRCTKAVAAAGLNAMCDAARLQRFIDCAPNAVDGGEQLDGLAVGIVPNLHGGGDDVFDNVAV